MGVENVFLVLYMGETTIFSLANNLVIVSYKNNILT